MRQLFRIAPDPIDGLAILRLKGRRPTRRGRKARAHRALRSAASIVTALVVASTLAVTTAAHPAAGQVPTTAHVVPIVPVRLLDTRTGVGAPATKVAPGGTVELTVTGGTAGVPGDAAAVALNVTATQPASDGFVTVWPCGTTRPLASNLNVTTGQTIPNLVISKVGTGGKVCLYSQPGTHLIADLNGFWGEARSEGEPGATQVEPIVQSGAAPPTGNAPADGLPTAGGDIVPGPQMAAAGTAGGLAPPTPEEAAAAPGPDDAKPIMPTLNGSEETASGTARSEMLANEPTYPIGSAGYVTGVDRAIGRVVMWTYSAAGGWRRASSCSGTVTGPNMVLTAAHCLTAYPGQPAFSYFSFIPGLYGSSTPVGEWFAPVDRAYAHQAWWDLTARGENGAMVLDYAFIKFDPWHNRNLSLSAYTGSFSIRMQSNLSGSNLYNVGYPAEGYYSSANQGWCNPGGVWCYPYHCQSVGAGQASLGGSWQMIGFGCNGNGGISGSGIFSQIGGTWYVVSVNDYGGDNRDRHGQLCPAAQRSVCSWYMRNSWGPEFRTGWLDALWHGVNNA